MSNGKDMIIYLIVEVTKKTLHKMSQYFPRRCKSFEGNIKVKVDLSNYATKAKLENAAGCDTSKLVAKSYVAT